MQGHYRLQLGSSEPLFADLIVGSHPQHDMNALSSLGVSRERLLSLDILAYNLPELLVAVLVVAAAFLALDLLLQLTCRSAMARLLCQSGCEPSKVPAKDVTKALVNIVSAVHLLVQIPVGILVLLDPRLAADPVLGVSETSMAMVVISSGYFSYELATVVLRYEDEGAQFLVHALCCLFVYGYAVFFGTLHWFGAAFLMWELSTPFVHIRWWLSATGRGDSTLYVANGLTMMAVFFLCRNVWGTWCSYLFFLATQRELDAPRGSFSPAGIWGYRVANVSLNALNWFWFSKMASRASRLLLGGKRGKKRAHDPPTDGGAGKKQR